MPTRLSSSPFRLVVVLLWTILIAPTTVVEGWAINTDEKHEAILLAGGKKIVFLTGPHNSGSWSVRKFVAKWAAPAIEGHLRSKALSNWRWGGNNVHKLITEPDEANEEVWEELKAKFEEPDSNGVIIGSQFFDQVGPSAKHDAVAAMKKIIETLGVEDPKKDVLVVEHYRTPRFDQFTSMWKHADGEYSESTYEDWLCDTHNKPDEQAKRLDMLGAKSNPLGASLAYLEQGWEVKLLETTGMDNADINVVQVVVTQILQGRTVNNLIASHEYVKNRANEGDRDFTEFNDTQTELAEELFRYRDCAYLPKLKPYMAASEKTLEVLYNHSLFSTCDGGSKAELYQRLVDNPEIMYSALLQQLKCPNHDVDFAGHTTIAQALGYETQTESEKQEAIQHKIDPTMAKKPSSGKKSSGGGSSAGGSSSPSTMLIAFQILTVALFGYQVFKINLSRPLRKPEPPKSTIRNTPSMELEMEYGEDPELVGDNNNNIIASEMVKLAPSTGKGN
ncbi:MAG: hypothetical protein SGBAC_011715 [Bacillariaceae sp.]